MWGDGFAGSLKVRRGRQGAAGCTEGPLRKRSKTGSSFEGWVPDKWGLFEPASPVKPRK